MSTARDADFEEKKCEHLNTLSTLVQPIGNWANRMGRHSTQAL